MPEMPQGTSAPPAQTRIGAGPVACEELLLADLEATVGPPGPDALERRVLIVVPSTSLRDHLLTRIAARFGRAVAGVACRTLHRVATEIVERAEGPPPSHEDLAPILARRFAAAEEPLRRSLGHLADGFAPLAGPVRDLLDAGLAPAHAEALLEVLREEGPAVASRPQVERAECVVRVAARVRAALEAPGLGRSSTLLERATEHVRTAAEPPLAPGAVAVFGFNDATGTATDLIEALLGRFGGRLYLDRPPDPGDPARVDFGVRFTRRFAERLAAMAPVTGPPASAPPARIEMFRAIGAAAEMREVAGRLRALLDAGAAPERIGIVARRLAPYGAALRTHFRRLGVPFSTAGAGGPATPAGRRMRAVADLMTRRGAVPLERWLEARAGPGAGAGPHEMRLALFGLGAGRLEEVPGLDLERRLERGAYRLPVRRGLRAAAEEGGDGRGRTGGVVAPRRRVPKADLERHMQAAGALCSRLERWEGERRLGGHLKHLGALLHGDLGWREGESPATDLLEAVDRATRGLDPGLELSLEELLLLLAGPLEKAAAGSFGGGGGGVQVLDVTEARGRTFENLFVVGLNRGVFPRSVREDPLLPDELRAVLGRSGFGVLPDLPAKLDGFDEERFLFAQLAAAAPRVTLSWLEVDDEGAAMSPSPLVERIRWSDRAGDGESWRETPLVGHLYAAPGRADRPAYESAIVAGIHGARADFAEILPLALEEGGRTPEEAEALAATRLAILEEIDPPWRDRRRPGPYFGFVGPPSSPADPRQAGDVWVTTLERLAACPWQTFLERLLRLEPYPDPLEVLPGIDALLVGQLVHHALEEIAGAALSPARLPLAEAASRSATRVPWPPAAELESLLRGHAEAVAAEHGIGVPGFPRALAAVARPYLDVARRLDWRAGGETGPATVAVEAEGAVEVVDPAGRPRTVRFKADRADRREPDASGAGETAPGAAGLVLTDYKTGRRGLSRAARADTRRSHFLAEVRSGRRLQAVAYALGGGEPARGRYLFLHPDLGDEPGRRQPSVESGDGDFAEAFAAAVRATLSAWDRGALFPRLVEPDQDREPRRCEYCEVAEACLRGDSGARARLRDWAEGAAAGESDGAFAAAAAVWELPARSRPGRPEGGR